MLHPRQGLIPAVVVLLLAPIASFSQTIDFETLPGGAPTADQQLISTEYDSLGVTFSLLDVDTDLPIGSPRIAKVGLPQTAFDGCQGPDTPWEYLGLGTSFLTDGTQVSLEGHIRIEFSTLQSEVSGLILDVDCRNGGNPPCEAWTVTGYDSAGGVIDSTVVNGPVGAPKPECPGTNGLGDAEAFSWSLNAGGPIMHSVIMRYTGAAPSVGLGLDNLTLGPPGVLDLVTSAAADTVCAGEAVLLEAFPSGGRPPFSFQWQQEIGGGSWLNLGTSFQEAVTVYSTSTYRVIVTDSGSDEVTGVPITITALEGDPLCSSSLLVASFGNDRVVRYSFLSSQGDVFVSSGSGGLNGASKITCGPDGNLYVCSQVNNRVLRYDGATGGFIDVFVTGGSGGLSTPIGLDFGPDGNLYVASTGNHSILRYDGTTGAYIDTFVPNGSGLNGPTGIVWGPDNNLYVCSLNADKVLRFDQAGSALGDFVTSGSGGLDAPRGLTFGPDGHLYIAEQFNDSVRRFNGTTGAFIDVFVASGSGGLDRANDVIFGPDGMLYVASLDNSMVLRYDGADGSFVDALPGDLLNAAAWFALACQPWVTTGIRDDGGPAPSRLTVEPNVPNPFSPRTTIGFSTAAKGGVRVTVLDISGRVVATLLDKSLPPGRHTAAWDGRNERGGRVPAGIYFIRVLSNGSGAIRKVTLLP